MTLKEGIGILYNSKSKTFLTFCFCFLAGVALASFADWDRHVIFIAYGLSLIIIFFIAFFWNKPALRFVFLCAIFFVIGICRYVYAVPDAADAGNISYYIGEKMELNGVVVKEPKLNISGADYVIGDLAKGQKTLSGGLYLQLPLYPEYKFGERLWMACYLSAPKTLPGSDFQFDKYLATQGIWATCQYPKVSGVGNNKTGVAAAFFGFKKKVSSRVADLWPEPESSLIGGLLYGDRSGLPKELVDNFNRTGLSHIVAVSGYNISIVAVALMFALIAVGLYRGQAFWVAVLGIILFVFFCGGSSSAVRAGVMGIVVLTGQYIGRPSRSAPALILAAALMVFVNPYILLWDVGFQLSFAATIGIIYLAPVFTSAPAKENALLTGMHTTIAAIIATMPLILYQFGRFSIVALIANLLILWLIPYLMFFGFLSLTASIIFFPIGQVLAWLTGFGLKYMLLITEFLGRQSWSAVDMKMPWWGMILMYLVIIWIFVRVYYKNIRQVKNYNIYAKT